MIFKEQFLPSITTLSAKFKVGGNSWQDKIKEIDELGLERVAIFPTCLDKTQRQEMYGLLEKTKIKEIPFAHIKSDMDQSELDYLADRFKTRVFNTHTERQYPFVHNLEKYKQRIFIENTWPWEEEEIKNFAGICLDFSHLYDDKIFRPKDYENNLKIISQYPIGCNHISAITKEKQLVEDGSAISFDRHYFKNLSEFNYLKEYPKEWFSNYIAIEVENSLAEQLKVIDYITNTLSF